MAEQRQFRFRLPWLSAATTPPRVTTPPRPVPEPQVPRPTPVEIRAPPQPTATISTQRPPFRPAGIAPPTAAQVPAAQRPSPPRTVTTESQPASPVITQQRGSSVPTSPYRSAAAESKVASLPPSPSRVPPQSRAASVPPSPSRTETRTQLPEPAPAARTASQPPSPSRRVPATGIQPSIAPPTSASPQKKPQLPIAGEASKPQSMEEIAAPKTEDQETEHQKKATSEAAIKGPARFSPFSRASEERQQEIRTEGQKMKAAPAAEDNNLRNRVAAFLSSAANATHSRGPVNQEDQEEKQEIRERKKPATGFTQSEEKVKGVSSSQSRIRKTATANGRGEQVPLHKEIKEDISKLVQKLGMGHIKHPIGGEQQPVSVVTLSGENRGATMLFGADPERKEGSLHIHRGYKTNPDDSIESTTDGEGIQKMKDSKNPGMEDEQPSPMAYINSNTQSINNSILLDSMVNESNPGVHFSLSHSDQPELSRSAIDEEPRTHRAEFNPTPSEKLTYEPRLRRRCLRGLFMETSDSEPDNPDKPRKHGCRAYGCGQTSKERDIGVL
ncbi:unnamed protein product [Linum trigynum]|uniref:Uncharacterized protein n=1 Tax=Linum trigynum TaxID=586398 RepID=A0AAV2EF55_9ROSI